MSPEDEIKKVQEILTLVHTQKRSRLMNGALRRRDISEAVERGETPTGYRVNWLSESSRKVLLLLQEISAEFNDKYKDDAVSVNDLIDIVAYVMAALTEKTGE